MSSRVSTTTGEEITDAFILDYAPTGRAACKKCGSNIGDGSIRVSKKVRSRFHDGFDFQLLHWRCGEELASSLDGFIGWQRLRWADIEKLLAAKGQEFNSGESQLIENLRKRNAWLSDATEHLSGAPLALLKAVLDANAVVYSDKAKGVELAGIIAEQLLFGKLPACPTCNTFALRQDGTDYRCHGWFSASTKCAFRFRTGNLICGGPKIYGGIPVGDEAMLAMVSRRGILSLPEDAQNHKIFKTIKIPREIISEQKKRKNAPTNSASGISNSACELLDSEIENDAPQNLWLAGLRFCFLGCPRKYEVSAKIVDFGGEVQEELEVAGKQRTTHLIVGEDELDRDPKAQRYRAAVDAGVPIVFDSFIDSFTDTTAAPEIPGKVSISGRSKEKKNSQINGDYEHAGNFFCDRPVFVKSGKTELYLFYCAEKKKWKINPKLASDAGQVASNSDPTPLPQLCGKIWSVFDGKDEGFREDKDVVVHANAGPSLATGVALRQRKILRKFLVDSGLGRKIPKIAEVVKQREAEKNRGKKRAAPIKGSPLLTVDDECDLHDCEIFVDHHQNAFNAYLTRTDAVNNVNKFYAIQLLVSGSSRDKFSVFRKWGRVGGGIGKVNDLLLVKYRLDKKGAIEEFEKKFEELTGWKWAEREGAEQKPGRYAQVELSGQDDVSKPKKKKKTDDVPCTLPTPVRALIETIFDSEMVEHTMRKQLDIDTAQLPLHALSKRQIEQGLSVLKEIANILSSRENVKENLNKSSNVTASQLAVLKLKDASSRYFTLIPHTFGAKQSVPVIEDVRTVKKETRAMEDLLNIVDFNTVRAAADHLSGKHIFDLQYEKLGCSISPVDSASREWDWISKYVSQTHAPTHNDYSLQVVHVLDVHRTDEVRAFESHHVRHNRQMLWHGSRITNWVSILSNGLRIAPKEAPVTGYMFGKGIYFSDVSSKSANYCKATSDSPHGVLALCDVALGDCYMKLEAEYEAIDSCKAANLHSTFAVGQTAPSYAEEVADGVHAPLGTLDKNDKLLSEARSLRPKEKPSLLYNEYVVYDPSQVRIKYLVFVKFAFESGSLLD